MFIFSHFKQCESAQAACTVTRALCPSCLGVIFSCINNVNLCLSQQGRRLAFHLFSPTQEVSAVQLHIKEIN